MNISIITFYWSKNLGALIQSLSLKKFVKEINDINKVEFNSYQPKQLMIRELNGQLKTYNPIKYFKAKKKNKLLTSWKNLENFPHPSTIPNSFDDDLYIYGSDEIWNFQSSICKFDPHFYGVKNTKKKIAYAASIGNAKYDTKLKEDVSKSLKSFLSISVRDKNTFKFVKSLTGANPIIVCDPSLLIEMKSENINLSLSKNIGYALVYGRYFSNREIKDIKKYALNKNLKIVSVSYYNIWADLNLLHINPSEFIYLIRNSNVIFTSMFHGVMLSFKYKKNFWFSQDPYRINKLSFFIEKFKLMSRTMENLDNNKINYNLFENSLSDWIEQSKEYLIQNIR